MLQIVQNLKSGETTLVPIPRPCQRKGHLVIRSGASLISPGTEKMLTDFGKAGLIGKAKSQPEKVKQAIDKVKTDGLAQKAGD
jgi:hypothetical protein